MCMNTHTCTRKHAHTHTPLPRGPFLRVGAHLLMSSPRRNAASPLPPPAADCAISRGPGYTKAGRFPAAGAGALSSLKPPPWFLAPTPVFIFWLHPHSCLAAVPRHSLNVYGHQMLHTQGSCARKLSPRWMRGAQGRCRQSWEPRPVP